MVRLEKNKIIVEIDTPQPADTYVDIKKSLNEIVFRASESELDNLGNYLVDVNMLMQELELKPEQAIKLIEG